MKELLKILLLKPLFNGLVLLTLIVPSHSLGWAIIALTVFVRLLLLPSTNSATKAQKKMKELQPLLQKIKTDYKDDQAKQAQETMALYKRYGVNPFGSCLPLLVQFPILIILFYVLRFITSEGHRWDLLYSWVPQPAQLNSVFFGIDLGQPDLWVLPILAGVLQFIATRQLQPVTSKGKNEDMTAALSRQMIYLFPLMTIWIARSFPAALPLYWVASTIFTIIQQKIILGKNSQAKLESKEADRAISTRAISEIKHKAKGGVEVTVRQKRQKK